MKVFLAGTYTREFLFTNHKPKYILESFYYVTEWQAKKIKEWDMFLLDSGAFTFMSSAGDKKINWKEYIDSYCDFINKYDIKYFFELDIDVIVGHEKVKDIRKYIEQCTGKKCIPVWHKSRGLDEYINLTKEYSYIAIGGIVTKEIKQKEYPVLQKLIQIAHDNNCKVHGLGFTNTTNLHKYHFDSVDSTSWLSASRFAQIQYFDGKVMKQFSNKNKKMIHYKKVDDFVFGEWIKFQEYADRYL